MSEFWQGNLFDVGDYEDLSLETPYVPETIITGNCVERLGQLVLKVLKEENEYGDYNA